jgi:hypothetical protein
VHTDKYFTEDRTCIFETDEESGEVRSSWCDLSLLTLMQVHNIEMRQTNLKEQLCTNDDEFVAFIEW